MNNNCPLCGNYLLPCTGTATGIHPQDKIRPTERTGVAVYNVGDTVYDPTSGEKGVVEDRDRECSLHDEVFQSHQELRLWLVDSEEYVWRCSQAVAPVTV